MVQDSIGKMQIRQDVIVQDDPKAKRAAVSAISTRSLNGPIEGSTALFNTTTLARRK